VDITSVTLLERLHQPAQPEAWARFVDLYQPLLLFWARGLGLQDQDAADLVQDIFVTLVQKMPEFTYDAKKSFRAWLRTVTLNKWRDQQRHRAVLPLNGDDAALAQVADTNGHDVFAEAAYRKRVVAGALKSLQSEFLSTTWQAFWQHGVLSRPAAVVAVELGVSGGAVYSAKFRVLARLRQEVNGLLD
jgi:RNA polymerase sigma-70 factor (ECF subfamily)